MSKFELVVLALAFGSVCVTLVLWSISDRMKDAQHRREMALVQAHHDTEVEEVTEQQQPCAPLAKGNGAERRR